MGRYQVTNIPQDIQFECGENSVLRRLQNVKNLLMCQMGTVPYDRYRGFDHALFDLPFGEMKEALLPEIDRVLLWEPAAEAVDAQCRLDEHGGIVITVTIELDEGKEAIV